MAKKIILISISAIFLLVSAGIIGWIIKKEIEKGKNEQQQRAANKNDSNNILPDKNSNINDSDKEVTVNSKNDANKILEDMDSTIDSIGSESETK